MWGGFLTIAVRWEDGVSPVLGPTMKPIIFGEDGRFDDVIKDFYALQLNTSPSEAKKQMINLANQVDRDEEMNNLAQKIVWFR